jgi:hypothetical protein
MPTSRKAREGVVATAAHVLDAAPPQACAAHPGFGQTLAPSSVGLRSGHWMVCDGVVGTAVPHLSRQACAGHDVSLDATVRLRAHWGAA